MKNFQNKVIYEEFGKQAPLEVLSNCMVGTEHFYKQYKEATNWYAKYNSEKNIGNIHYRKETDVKPYSLIHITK